jgi:3-hydroxybutyryl-CoA dehydrogenase
MRLNRVYNMQSLRKILSYKFSKTGISVIGGGQMGSGIALVAAKQADLPVKIIDRTEDAILRSRNSIEALLKRNLDKGQINTEQMFRILTNLSYSVYVEDAMRGNVIEDFC